MSNPVNFINNNFEVIIRIRNFLKNIALEYGKFRIYGYYPFITSSHSLAYGHSKTRYMAYYLEHYETSIDPNMPEGNKWYFEIDSSDNFKNFDAREFIIFLGAIIADGQMFLIRGFDEMGRFLPQGEFIFIGSLLNNHISLSDLSLDFTPSSKFVYPVLPGYSLYYSDELTQEWFEICEQFSQIRCQRPRKISDWIRKLDSAGINENFFLS